jgi:hypothetical protein
MKEQCQQLRDQIETLEKKNLDCMAQLTAVKKERDMIIYRQSE